MKGGEEGIPDQLERKFKTYSFSPKENHHYHS